MAGEAPRRIGYGFAKRHRVLVEAEEGAGTAIRFVAPLNPWVAAELRRFLETPLDFEPMEPQAFESRLTELYDRGAGGAREMIGDLGDELDLNRVAQSLPEPEDLLEAEDDAPIIRLINALLSQAIKEGASDIHIEPFEHRLVVRLRVDGVLREILEPPRNLGPLLVSRIKVMARLDIAEKRVPQDGRISLRVGDQAVDVRVSTLPSGGGERVVMRLLDKRAGRLTLEHLGMDEQTHERLREMLAEPHGMLLVTGPTGSGKTTTLYAALSHLNDRTRNILTVEDPVEYLLDGIGQTQVNTKAEMGFARGLRAILRQDPDVVMVGEIRDIETVEVAVQVALTGHLVLSTLHTNTAIGAITRLRDMGVEPFLLASTVIGSLAQRLVRHLCQECRKPYTADAEECAYLGVNIAAPPTLYAPGGCPACNGSGYRGRTGIYELVAVDAGLRTLIHDGAGEHAIEAHVRATTPGIAADGARKVLAGVTSVEEVLRVTRSG